MKLSKLFSVLLTSCLLLVSFTSQAASDDSSTPDRQIINSEVIEVDGVPVTFTLYLENGIYSETVSFDKTQNSYLRTLNEQTQDEFFNKISAISDERAQHVYNLISMNDSNHKTLRSSWTEEKNNSAQGSGGGYNTNTFAGHWATVTYNPGLIESRILATNGGSRVTFNHPTIPTDKMKVTETISWSEPSISVSIPAGFSLSSGSNSASLSTTWDGDYGMCTQYRGDFGAKTPLYHTQFFEIKTDGQAITDNVSSSATVVSRW